MGPYNLHHLLLWECASALAYPFYLIFKDFLYSGLVPDIWKHSHTVPIFKKGSHTDPLKYRLISLTLIPCKSLKWIITESLCNFFDKHLILDDAQYEFWAYRYVTDQWSLTHNKEKCSVSRRRNSVPSRSHHQSAKPHCHMHHRCPAMVCLHLYALNAVISVSH